MREGITFLWRGTNGDDERERERNRDSERERKNETFRVQNIIRTIKMKPNKKLIFDILKE